MEHFNLYRSSQIKEYYCSEISFVRLGIPKFIADGIVPRFICTNVKSKENNIKQRVMSETEPTQATTGTPGDSSSNRSGAGRGRNGNRRSARVPTKKYKGKIENVLTLAAKSERTGYGYASFIKSLYEYCLANLKSPQDLAPVLLHRKDPMQTMGSSLPSLRSVATSFGMTLEDVDEDDVSATRKTKEKRNNEIKEMI